jgi:hypothetical protein
MVVTAFIVGTAIIVDKISARQKLCIPPWRPGPRTLWSASGSLGASSPTPAVRSTDGYDYVMMIDEDRRGSLLSVEAPFSWIPYDYR